MKLKYYCVLMLQLIIWSAYSLMEWLSKHDHPLYNVLMFLVFFYLSVVIGHWIIKSAKKTLLTTFFSLGVYSSFHMALAILQA
jgi:ABC-type iron transport system FetAB permease component